MPQTPRGTQYPPEFQADRYLKMDEPQLVAILKDPASTMFQKNIACRRLALIGTKQSVPVLAPMLADERTAHYARYALKPIPDPSVDDALRAAVPKLKGALLVGAINTIGHRGDTKPVELLTKLLASTDLEVAQAAAMALGQISGLAAMKSLQDGLAKTKGVVRTAVANGGLVCAENLVAQGDRKSAMSLYDTLSRPEMPKTVRVAAMHALIGAQKQRM